MINFEPTHSPFFTANKNYCESIESKLKTIHVDCFGWCNSYGYKIEATLKINNLTYSIKFHKHQSTQNGMLIPVDSLEYEGIDILVKGLNKRCSATIGKSALKRVFMSKVLKEKIPAPYFIKFNYPADANFIDDLVKKILNDNISTFKLSNGTLTCKIHTAITDPLDLIANIEKTIKNWE